MGHQPISPPISRVSESGAAPCNGYGRVRFLVGLHVVVKINRFYRLGRLYVEEVALVLEGVVLGPELEDDVHRFLHPLSWIRGLSVQAENLKVGVHAAGADAHVEPALGQVVQHGYAMCHHHRVMESQEYDAGGQYDTLRLSYGSGDKKVRGGACSPRRW